MCVSYSGRTVTVKLRFVGQRLFYSMFRKFALQVKDLTQCQTGGNSNRMLWFIFTYSTLFSCFMTLTHTYRTHLNQETRRANCM